MTAHDAARVLAAGRVVVGGALLAAPGTAARGWIGPDADREPVRVLTRALGVRDLILGAITLRTLGHPEVGPRWLATCAAADAVDLAATLAARDRLPPLASRIVMGVAAGAAAGGLALSAAMRRG